MRFSLIALLVTLVGCDALDTSTTAPSDTTALATATTVGCLLADGETAGVLVSTDGEIRVVAAPLLQAGCVLNRNTGVLQFTAALPPEDTPTTAQVLTEADAPDASCGTVFGGETVFTQDFTVVNTPSGRSKSVCRFRL